MQVRMNRNTEQFAVSSGLAYLESATRYLERRQFASARTLVEEGIMQTEVAQCFEVHRRLLDLSAVIALKVRTGSDDTVSILGRTYYVGSDADDDLPAIGLPTPSVIH
jgi:hypothetical protein